MKKLFKGSLGAVGVLGVLAAGFLIWHKLYFKGGEWPPPFGVGETVTVSITVGDFTFPSTQATVLAMDWRPAYHEFDKQWWFFVTNEDQTVSLWLPQQTLYKV